MSWLLKNDKVLQLSLLLLLAASFLGPWTYDADGVPPPEYCDPPLLLLTPERCVKLVSGAGMLGYLAYFFQELLVGALNNQALALIEVWRVLLLILIFSLPALPVLVLTWRVLASFQLPGPAGQSSLQGRNLLYVSLVLGWLAALLPVLFNWPPQPWLFWGLWLYLIVNDAILMLNVLLQSRWQAQNQAI